jgi:4-amino-4-deoxy-L-arabinose transferase-like glycosyltransferase
MIAWYLVLGAFASLRTPLYQGADEGWHYAYVEHYALGRGLPNLNAHFLSGDLSAPYWQTHEASQAPLYYMLSSLITRWIPRGDLMQEQVLDGNVPNGMYGNFLPADTGTSYTGHALAGKLVRLLTVGYGMAVIACGYFIAQLATSRQHVAFLTAALLALNPRMIVLGGAISNDMPMAAAAVALLLITRYVTLAAQTWRHAFLIGAFTGIALLMKFNGGVIFASAGTAFL